MNKSYGWLAVVLLVLSFNSGCGNNSGSPSSPSSPSYTYPFLFSFGQNGAGVTAGNFSDNTGIAVGYGDIFVGDDSNNVVQKFDMNGNYLMTFATSSPEGLALDKNGHLYVASDAVSVTQCDLNGNVLKTFTGTGTFFAAWDVKVDSNLNLFVLDIGNAAVYKVNPSDVVQATSTGGTGLSIPEGLSIDANDNVYVSDFGHERIVVYNSSLVYQTHFADGPGSATTVTGQLYRPEGNAIDSDGNLIVCDEGDHRLEKFSPSGSFISLVGSQTGSSPVTYSCPFFMTVDSNKRVYVSDDCNHKIYVLAPY